MNRRLEQFLLAENISQSQFADTIGVARASISHIIAGRNKPGFDFLERTLASFPALNIEWLISGKGKMYRTSVDNREPDILFPFTDDEENSSDVNEEEPVQSPGAKKTISKIIVYYSDNTFKEVF